LDISEFDAEYIYPHNVSTNLMLPLFRDAASSLIEAAHPESGSVKRRSTARDIWLCESVQRGPRSATYYRGRYSVRGNGLHYFHMLLREFLEPASGFTDVN
jgi:hypothetical protein